MKQILSNGRYASLFKVLADETRVGILRLLSKGERTVGDLAETLGLSLPRISHHLSILRSEGLIVDRREGKYIYCALPSPGEILATQRHSEAWIQGTLEVLALLAGKEEAPIQHTNEECLSVYAASSLCYALEEIGQVFEQKSGISLQLRLGASETLAQELEGGVYADIFVSSSLGALERLNRRGILADIRPIAKGRLALWMRENLEVGQVEDLLSPKVKWVAIANPSLAPVGVATEAYLRQENLWEELQPKLFLGNDALQAQQFADTDNAGVAITSLAVAPEHGRSIPIPADSHHPLEYGIGVTQFTSRTPYAEAFTNFLLEKEAQEILHHHGLSSH